MKKLFNIDSFSHKGKRDNNEDSYFPNNDIKTDLENLFLVCDGLGGHDKGEIASNLCCTQLNAYFSNNKIKISDKQTIKEAVKFLGKQFDNYIKDNPESVNMASTITFLHLHEKGATVAHMGDSRVYHFRNGKILFRTKDHTIVQALLDAKVITSDKVATHKDKNRLSRAMCGANIKSYTAETKRITDLKEDDIFFMCSDGVLESFSDSELEKIFEKNDELETFGARIVRKCAEKSADNYTGYIIQLKKDYIESLNIDTKYENSSEKKQKEKTTIAEEKTLIDESMQTKKTDKQNAHDDTQAKTVALSGERNNKDKK